MQTKLEMTHAPRLSFEDKVITVLGFGGLWLLSSGIFWEQVMLRSLDCWLRTPEGGQHRLALSALVHVPADFMMITGAAGVFAYVGGICVPAGIKRLCALIKRSNKGAR